MGIRGGRLAAGFAVAVGDGSPLTVDLTQVEFNSAHNIQSTRVAVSLCVCVFECECVFVGGGGTD